MLRDPLRGEATAATEDGELRLVVDNAALLALEDVLDRSFLEVAGELLTAETTGEPAKLGTMQAVTWAALRAHHPEWSLAHCGDLLLREGAIVRPAMIEALAGALPRRKDDEPGEAAAPATTSARGTGKGSPNGTSKPAAG